MSVDMTDDMEPNSEPPDVYDPTDERFGMVPPLSYRERMYAHMAATFGRCIEISRKKNADYSAGLDPFKNFRLAGEYGFTVRLSDKVSRLMSLMEPGAVVPEVQDESIDDTIDDLINYGLLLRAYRALK